MTKWRLGTNVFAAEVHGDLVFLDAGRNQYSCLTRSDAGPIRRLLGGASQSTDDDELARELQAAGLIEPSPTLVPALVALEHTATGDFHDYAADLPVTFTTLRRLAAAAIEVAIARTRGPLSWFENRHPCPDIALTRACTLAKQFDRMRPLIPRSGRCLPSSMLLLAFLRRHGVRARWVFGVQTFPFEAHCWIEYRGVVLNDTFEHVRWYTPIAAV